MSTVTVFLKRANGMRFDVKVNGNDASVNINGANSQIKGANGLVIPVAPIPFGDEAYGITKVDADLWDAVLKDYGNHPFFERGIILYANSTKGEAEAKEQIKEVEKTDDPIVVEEGENVEEIKPKRGRKKKA